MTYHLLKIGIHSSKTRCVTYFRFERGESIPSAANMLQLRQHTNNNISRLTIRFKNWQGKATALVVLVPTHGIPSQHWNYITNAMRSILHDLHHTNIIQPRPFTTNMSGLDLDFQIDESERWA